MPRLKNDFRSRKPHSKEIAGAQALARKTSSSLLSMFEKYEYSEEQRSFVVADRRVPYSIIRHEIDNLTNQVKTEAGILAKRTVDEEGFTPSMFESRMQELLRSGHIIASSVGRGGIGRMTQSDWARIGTKLKWQYGYLRKFARRMKRLTPAQAQARAKVYAGSIYVSFAASYRVSQIKNAV